MHELSLALSLIAEAERVREQEGAVRVLSVTVKLGPLSGVERAALEFCFPFAAEGTAAAGATLECEEAPLVVRCRDCGRETEAKLPELCCGSCGALAVEVVSGKEFLLLRMEVE